MLQNASLIYACQAFESSIRLNGRLDYIHKYTVVDISPIPLSKVNIYYVINRWHLDTRKQVGGSINWSP